MFGAFAYLPIRLTSLNPLCGWSASQHSRMVSDLVSGWRSLPLAVMTVQVNSSSATLLSYNGRNGSGTAHAPSITYTSSTHPCTITWENSYEDELENISSWSIKHGVASIEYAGSKKAAAISSVPGSTNKVDLVVEAGATTPYRVTIVVYGSWGNDRQIGDYDGDPNKTDNVSEAEEPYAAQWYREIRASRGNAYTDKEYTLVDYENIAASRLMGAIFSRTPEKYSANSTPAHATERLGYWVNVLGIPSNPNEPDWLLRSRAAAHFRAAIGPTLANVNNAVSSLLGPAFVGIDTYLENDLENPPFPTLWPGGTNDGGTLSIGGYTWLSRRAHLRIQVQEPPGMTRADFLNLMNVQLFQLLDRMLPSWATWNWSVGSDGFLIGIDQIGIDAI